MCYKRWRSASKDFTPCQSAGSTLLRRQMWRVPVLNRGKTSIELSAERHNSRIRIHVARLYRYSFKWLHGTLQATVSWNPHRRHTANMPLVFHSTGADGYDMDYTDSKSIRPRSWVCTGLVNCFWASFYDFVFLIAHASLLFSSIWSCACILFFGVWVSKDNFKNQAVKCSSEAFASWWLQFWLVKSE